MADRKPHAPREIDDIEDRMGSVHPLDFDQKNDDPGGRIGDTVPERSVDTAFPPERVREAGMTTGEVPDGHTTKDDLAPETLFETDGSRGPDDLGPGIAADQDLSEVPADRIGAGDGMDEAEEGRYDPLDGKPWDGPADGDDDTGLGGGDAVLAEDAENALSDEELEGDAPLDSARDKKPDL